MIALVLLATSFIVLAEDEAQQTLTNLDYNSVKQYLDQITSKVWFKSEFWGLNEETLYLINKFVQAVFWIAKFLFKIFAGIYEILSSANGLGNISDLIRTVIQEMSQVFSALKDSFLLPAGVMMASYAVYVFFVKNGSFVKTLLKLLAVFAFSGILFTQTTIQGKSGYVAEILYDTVETVTAELSGKVTSNLTSIQSGQTAVLDQYFLNAIWTPYSHMNGEDKKGQIILTDDQLKRLVFYNDGDDDFLIDGKKMKDFVGDNKKSKYYGLLDSWGVKFSYAFVAIIETFVMGVIVDGFAIFAFVMKLVFILIVFLSPVAMLLSLIPTFENILFNVYKRMLLSLGISGSMAVISTLFLYFYNKLGEILTVVVGGNIILGTVLKAIVLFILWKKRDWLISILTANRVTSVAQNWVQNLPQLNTQRQVSDLEYEGENDDSQRISRMQKGNWKEWLKNKAKPREQVSSDFDGSSASASDTRVDVELIPQPIQRPSFESIDSSPSFVEEPSLKSEKMLLTEEDMPKPMIERPSVTSIPFEEGRIEEAEELLEEEQRPSVSVYQPNSSYVKWEEKETLTPSVDFVESMEVAEERLERTRKDLEVVQVKQESENVISKEEFLDSPFVSNLEKPVVKTSSKTENRLISEPEVKMDQNHIFNPEESLGTRSRFRIRR